MVAEIFQVSLNRQMGANHPIYQLLHPHFFATLFINQVARTSLMALDGVYIARDSEEREGGKVLICRSRAYQHRDWCRCTQCTYFD
jgi:Lipoxygenase